MVSHWLPSWHGVTWSHVRLADSAIPYHGTMLQTQYINSVSSSFLISMYFRRNACYCFKYNSFHLIILGAPDPPESLEALNISHQGVILTWSSGFDGGLTQTFQLKVQKNQEKTMTFIPIPVNLTSYFVSGLTQGTTYHVSISAKNMLGDSQYTEPITFRTKSKTDISIFIISIT